ncbi:hypothetical protein DRN73_03930 [Candidatus Pacearchaeota archaeon]|nr:MAG: hypothetical protein DRN73_03930 [Candidatus Pacearchaeota archaeon]
MKHSLKITGIILLMFLLTQLIGLFVVNHYSTIKIIQGNLTNVSAPELPFGMETPEIEKPQEFNQIFLSIIIAFIIAISLLFFLMRFKAEFFLKLWFFIVIIIALGISFNSIIPNKIAYSSLIALIIALPLAFIKIYKRSFLIHNLTELFIYPGIAAVFVPILNFYTVIILLLLISVYDMWAVWHSGIMQKMAKYQINKLKVFSGFFIPYLNEKTKAIIKKIKNPKELEKKKVKVNIAILGGGDVIFPIIAAGVMLKTFGFVKIAGHNLPLASLLVILGAIFGLSYLFFFSEKKKFYPAMPFITSGIFLGIALSWIIYSKILGLAINFGFLF